MMHEAQMHEANSFITLTYDKEHLPTNASLQVDDWQRFAKRLRKEIGPFRFFHCGEYGTLNQRPHYHAALFGIDFSADRVLLREKRGANLYASPLLQRTWGNGDFERQTIGALSYQSAAYIARYVMKKITGPNSKDYYGNRKPEYVTMSRRPGIGSTWWEKYHAEVEADDTVTINGRQHKPPRYYDDKLPEKQLQEVKKKRADIAAKHKANNTPERLRVRETVTNARLQQLTRTL